MNAGANAPGSQGSQGKGSQGDIMEDREFTWDPQEAAGRLVQGLVEEFVAEIPFLEEFSNRLKTETGTRLVDWVDHFDINFEGRTQLQADLSETGFTRVEGIEKEIYSHQGALFPALANSNDGVNRIGIKVESVPEFLAAHQVATVVSGGPLTARRIARIDGTEQHEFWVIEKHGVHCWENPELPASHANLIPVIYESFLTRDRRCETNREGFQLAAALIDDAVARIGVDRTCDLFFAAERHYWQIRNRAARIQKSRQDVLGMGWANHDHHTYRSSRESFADLVRVLEKLGFYCRENFYAGAEAGWGAQVLEQPQCGLVVFADVDLSEEELSGDFAHDGLEPKEELGTVGLWCALHGEAFLEAGLHHLECQFDYAMARELLATDGVSSMDPFTDFTFLKQCFTTPEIWQVNPARIDQLLASQQITSAQADEFRQNGAVGSHLEILERNDGYKGFNQTGVSKIIAKTDPRKLIES